MIRIYDIGKYERGFLFKRREFVRLLAPGRHVLFDPLLRYEVEVEDVTDPRLTCSALDVIVASGALSKDAIVIDLSDHERALVWIDDRLSAVLTPGLYAYWTVLKRIRVERLDATAVRLDAVSPSTVMDAPGARNAVEIVDVEANTVGLFYVDGVLRDQLAPGRFALWKGVGRVEVRKVELREQVLDISGQEIMTADKVTLRLNAVLTYTVADPELSVKAVANTEQTIYREVQLALRAIIGTKTLDALLDEKDKVRDELAELVRPRLSSVGLGLVAVGIRDIILPGEMKDLLNRVTEAKKASEANLITRREETAAIRSQLNAARLLESNPTLMRLRELEVLEKVTEKANLSVVLGDTGLADKVVKLL